MIIQDPPKSGVARLLDDPGRLAIGVLLLLAAFVVLWFARSRLVAPLDGLVTERLCAAHGEEIGRVLADYDRSNRFGLRNRSEGFCHYGPGDNGEPAISVPFADSIAGPMLTATKLMGIIVQFGVASIFLRLVTDPVLNAYAVARNQFGSGRDPVV